MDYLIREYDISREELLPLVDNNGMLFNDDPKALLARGSEPLDPNSASFDELVRIPGIGSVTARSIIRMRERHPLRAPHDLGMNDACIRRAMPYLAFSGAGRQATLAGF